MKIIDKKTFRFILVGSLNTLIGTLVMFIAYNFLSLNYWISTILNYLLGSIFSFFANKYYTFNNKEKNLNQVLIFILNITICYFISYSLSKLILKVILTSYSNPVQENISMLFGSGFFIILNYFGQRFIVFKENKEKK